MYDTIVLDDSDDSVDAIDAIDSDDSDDLRLLLLMLSILLLLLILQGAPAALVSAIFCQAAGSIIRYGLLGHSKMFWLISGDCRCRWGMTSRSAASGQISCSDFARSQELALSFFSENELIKFFKVAPIPFPGVWESAE